MRQSKRVVIVGAGQAGARSAATLRDIGFDGVISLVGDEAELPYERPALSKGILQGTAKAGSLRIFDESFYANQAIDLLLGIRAERLDIGAKRLMLEGNRYLAYDKLILATGSRARTIDITGLTRDRVLSLRNIADAEQLKRLLRPGCKVAVLGGGFIGLEVAASAVGIGCSVTVIETRLQLIERVLSEQTSRWLAENHLRHGVALKTGCMVIGAECGAGGVHLALSDGTSVSVDIVIVGVGAAANLELAQQAGLACSIGMHVDEFCRSAAPDVFAVGDVAAQFHPLYDDRMRLESWDNAEWQARIAAKAMLAFWNDPGKVPTMNTIGIVGETFQIPWFWTDQYDVNLQIVGRTSGSDRTIVRGDAKSTAFIVFHLKADRLIGAEIINCGRERRIIKHLIALERLENSMALADTSRPLKSLYALQLQKLVAK